MKYLAPAGQPADAPYLDGNRNAGVRGSVVPGKAIEHPQRELAHLIDFAGLTPADSDLEQVRKAIEALIAAATGGGDTSQFLLVSQARARLPIFPEVLSADGRINVTSPAAGSVLVPPTVAFQHRGIFPLSTSDYGEPARTFVTAASKTYHLRWTPGTGFALRDLADAGYNPTAAAEGSTLFDTTYDDMLVARITTSVANVASIVNLANHATLALETLIYGTNGQAVANNGARFDIAHDFNWARRPSTFSLALARSSTGNSATDDDFNISLRGNNPEVSATAFDVNRYRISQTVMRDYAQDIDMHFSARA